MRWLTNFYDFSFKWTATVAIGIHPTKAWLSQLVNFKNAIWTWGHFRRTICNKIAYAIKLCFKLGKNATETYGMLQSAFRPSCMNQASVFEWHKRVKEGRESVRDDERCGRSKEVDRPELIGQRLRVKGYYVEVLREFRKRFRRKRPALFRSGQWRFHQDNAPVHNSILVTDYLTKMGTVPIVQTLLPVTFGYSLSSQALVMRELRRWKRLWRRSLTRSHMRTSMRPSRSCWNGTSALQPEEITSKETTVSCVYYQ